MSAVHDEVYLLCSTCQTETPHELTYAGRLLVDAQCLVCARDTSIRGDALLRTYLADLAHRVSTKPHRLARQARREPLRLIRRLPAAVLRQPRKLITEAQVVAHRYAERARDGQPR